MNKNKKAKATSINTSSRSIENGTKKVDENVNKELEERLTLILNNATIYCDGRIILDQGKYCG